MSHGHYLERMAQASTLLPPTVSLKKVRASEGLTQPHSTSLYLQI